MQVDPKDTKPKNAKPAGAKKPAPTPGPGLNVTQFVDLMRRLDSQKGSLSNEQVRFVQGALQRFEPETTGVVKTKLALPKPKKPKGQPLPSAGTTIGTHPTPATSEFIDRMVRLENEADVLTAIQHLSDADVERLTREQGFRASGPVVAREKLAETIFHLRQIERIAGAGTNARKDEPM